MSKQRKRKYLQIVVTFLCICMLGGFSGKQVHAETGCTDSESKRSTDRMVCKILERLEVYLCKRQVPEEQMEKDQQ